ncbi:MAG: MFS transporter [Ignavibacteria bacterium]|jgi:MFS family permease|nr:MFS transporter [Ignavibacteria bacterium]MCU7502600.1 MFS transporter [Ignavibacteria bacterium]MCU7515197.1 MFS transporter [Ignavibacteria bacterium]
MYKKNLVFAAACLGMLLFGMVFLSLGTVFTFITSKYGVSELTAASLASLLPIGILAGSVVFGPVVDRFGYKILLIVCSICILVAFEGIAFAGTFTILQFSFFLIGFGGGAINGGTNALVSDISTEEKGANLSLLGVFFGIGALGMPVVLGSLTKTYSYESVISGIGLFILLPLIFFIAVGFPSPKVSQGFPIKQSLTLIKESALLLMGFVLFFESGVEGIVGNWTAKYLNESVGLSVENALYTLSAQVVALTITRLILGFLLKKLPSYIVLYICMGAGTLGSILLLTASDMAMAIVGLAFLGVGFAATFPVVLGYVGNIYSKLSGTAFSIAIVIALIGNTLLNYIVGVISNSYGIAKFPVVLLISFIMMALVFTVVIRKISSKTKI